MYNRNENEREVTGLMSSGGKMNMMNEEVLIVRDREPWKVACELGMDYRPGLTVTH